MNFGSWDMSENQILIIYDLFESRPRLLVEDSSHLQHSFASDRCCDSAVLSMKCEDKEEEGENPAPSSSSSSSLATVMELNCGKAGMEGLDKERVNAVIEEASRGSKFYAAKMRAQERISRGPTQLKD